MIESNKYLEPLVSIITACYNAEKYIEFSIESVLNQTYRNLELILINDNSADRTLDICKEYQKLDNRVIIIDLKENLGPGEARNKGIEQAQGKYISFIDSDDLWVEKKLSIQITLMEKLNLDMTHTSYGYIDQSGNISKKTFKVSQKPVSYSDLLKRTEISCLTVVYNLHKFKNHKFADIRRKQDYVLWLSLLKHTRSVPMHYVSAYYRQGNNKKTWTKLNFILSHYKLLRSELIGLGFYRSIFYTLHYLLNGFSRYFTFIKWK